MFAPVVKAGVEIQAFETDTGVVQFDSISLDEEQTVRDAARFFASFERRVTTEAGLIRGLKANLVVGDIPPLACAAAKRAGVACVAIGNFTWDWIYEVYPAFERDAPEVIPAIRRAYAATTRALRLPLHGGFAPMAAVTSDIPLIARQSARDPEETRRRLGISRERPIVLTSFGRYGANLPIDSLRRTGRLTILDVPREPPAGLLYQDLVAAADVVRQQAGIWHRLGMRGERHRTALHVSRPIHRIRRLREGNATNPPVPLPLAGRSARRPLDRCHRGIAGAAGASRAALD